MQSEPVYDKGPFKGKTAAEAKAWIEAAPEEGEIGVGGFLCAEEAALYTDNIPLPPVTEGAAYGTTGYIQAVDAITGLPVAGTPDLAVTHTVNPFVTPFPGPGLPGIVPFNPLDPNYPSIPSFPHPEDLWPKVPLSPPWKPPFTDPDVERRQMEELAKLLAANSKNADKEEKLQAQVNKLKKENAELRRELYFLRYARVILESSPVYPTMTSGPFPIGDDNFEAAETVKATMLYNMLTPAEWDAYSLIEKAKLIIAYVEEASADLTIPNPRQYQINLETGKYS